MPENENQGSSGFRVTDRRGMDREPEKTEEAPKEPAGKVPRPPLDFTTFILSLASTAMIQMGAAPDPETGKVDPDHESARQTVDLLGMLRDKTRGNLTDDESRFFDAMLYDLRVRFVELTKAR